MATMAVPRSSPPVNDTQQAKSRCWTQGLGMHEINQAPICLEWWSDSTDAKQGPPASCSPCTKKRCRQNKSMRRLLPLIPLLALASCSTGHDLKSDKPVEMYCPGRTCRSIWTVDPKSSKVFVNQAQLSDGYMSEDKFILVEATPSRIVRELEGDTDNPILIYRDTKKVFSGKRLRTMQMLLAASKRSGC